MHAGNFYYPLYCSRRPAQASSPPSGALRQGGGLAFFTILKNENMIELKYIESLRFNMEEYAIIKNKISEVYFTYISYNNSLKNLKHVDERRVRCANFPECISEWIVFCVLRSFHHNVCRNVSSGDLMIGDLKVEIKCTQQGPISFGPTENWDILYIIHVLHSRHFKVYEIKHSNISIEWKRIKVSRRQSYEDQVKEKRRPRILLDKLLEQISYSIIHENVLSSFFQ